MQMWTVFSFVPIYHIMTQSQEITNCTGRQLIFNENVTGKRARVSGLAFHADSENQVSFSYNVTFFRYNRFLFLEEASFL